MLKNSVLSLLFLLVTAFAARAQQEAAIDSILRNYPDWTTVELSGKLKMEKLPLSPSLKIYMKRDSDIMISVRAPFVGEAGRIDIAGDSLLAVNKMRKVYCLESLSGLRDNFPELISMVQCVLLGRPVVLGSGQLTKENAAFVDITSADGDSETESAAGGWSIVFPKNHGEGDSLAYEYITDTDGRTESLLFELEEHDIAAGLDYYYRGKGYQMEAWAEIREERKFEVRMEFDEVKWDVEPMQPYKLNPRFTRVGFKDFLKSF